LLSAVSVIPGCYFLLSRALRSAKVYFDQGSFARVFYLFLLFRYSFDLRMVDKTTGFLVLSEYFLRGDNTTRVGWSKEPKRVKCKRHTTSDPSCSVCVNSSRYSKREVYRFPVRPRDYADDCYEVVDGVFRLKAEVASELIVETAITMVHYLINPKVASNLGRTTSLIASSSAMVVPVTIRGLSPKTYKYPFAAAPGNNCDVMEVLGIYNSTLSREDCNVTVEDNDVYVHCIGCGVRYDLASYVAFMNASQTNVPIKCVTTGCGHPIRIDSSTGEFGFHETWLAGHSVGGVAKLLGYFCQDTVNVSHDPHYFDMLSKAIKIMHKMCVPYAYRELPVVNFKDHVLVDAKMTAPGVIPNLPPGSKKFHVATATHDFITELAHEMSRYSSLEDKKILATANIHNISQTSIKQEVKAAKISPDGVWLPTTGERMFFVVSIIATTLIRMIWGVFAACGGYGTATSNVPSGIGMSFFGLSATVFASEMFRMPRERLELDVPVVNGSWDDVSAVNGINSEILEKFIIVEYDVMKWDIHMLGSFLASVCRSFLPFYNLRDDDDSRNFLAIFLRLVECHKFKVFNCPSGSAWYAVAACMMSGSWDTAFLNTMCNYVANLVVNQVLVPGFLDRPDWQEHYVVKCFGDDVLASYSRRHGDGRANDGLFTPEMLARIPELMSSMFRFKIPADDFKIHTRVFQLVSRSGFPFDRKKVCTHEKYTNGCAKCLGPYAPVDAPTFLKNVWVYVACSRCSTKTTRRYHLSYAREGYKILPKLFVDSSNSLTISKLQAKVLGYVYTVGVNPSVYIVLKKVWGILRVLKSRSRVPDLTPDQFSSDLDNRYGLDYEFWKNEDLNNFPTYQYIVDRMVCPYESGFGPIPHKTAMPYTLAGMKYQNWEDYYYRSPDKS